MKFIYQKKSIYCAKLTDLTGAPFWASYRSSSVGLSNASSASSTHKTGQHRCAPLTDLACY